MTNARYEKEVTKLTSEGKVQVMTGPFDLTDVVLVEWDVGPTQTREETVL